MECVSSVSTASAAPSASTAGTIAAAAPSASTAGTIAALQGFDTSGFNPNMPKHSGLKDIAFG